MNPDEDPPFSFICEGPSVLGIFGEPSGLSDMNSSAGVRGLVDVFVKTSEQSSQAETTILTENEKTVPSAEASKYDKQNSIVKPCEKDSKTLEMNKSDVQKDQEKNKEKSVDNYGASSTKGVLVHLNQSKLNSKSSGQSEAEVDEEMMDIIDSSKLDLDSENSISKIELCRESVINDSSSFEEELDSLEKLAMEGVCEIENDLESCSKQIVNPKLDSNLQKSEESDSVENEQRANNSIDISYNMTQSDHSSYDQNDKKGVLNEFESDTLSLISSIPLVKAGDDSTKVNSLININEEQSEAAEKQPLTPENDLKNTTKCSLEGKTDNAVLCKTDVCEPKVLNEELGTVQDQHTENDVDCVQTYSCELKTSIDDSESKKIVCDNGTLPSVDIEDEKHSSVKINSSELKSSNSTCKMLSSVYQKDIQCVSTDKNKEGAEHFDMKNYETEDDDLKVLEAFIVRSATDPEIAICSTKQIQDNSIKYSLESALLDDLTSTENENESSGKIDEEPVKTLTLKAPLSGCTSSTINSLQCHDQEQLTEEIVDNDSVVEDKSKTCSVSNRQLKSKPVGCVRKLLPLKKRLSPRKITELDERISDNCCYPVNPFTNTLLKRSVPGGVKQGRGKCVNSIKGASKGNLCGSKSQSNKNSNQMCQKQNVVHERYLFVENRPIAPGKKPTSNPFCPSKVKIIDVPKSLQTKSTCMQNSVCHSQKLRITKRKSPPTDQTDKKKRKKDKSFNFSSNSENAKHSWKENEENKDNIPSASSSTMLLKTYQPVLQSPSRNSDGEKKMYAKTASLREESPKSRKVSKNKKLAVHVQDITTTGTAAKERLNADEDAEESSCSLPIFTCNTLTYEILLSKAKEIHLPSPLWSVQIDSSEKFVMFLKIAEDLSDSPLLTKAILFEGSLKPMAFVKNDRVNIPIPSLSTLEDVVMLLKNYNDLLLCEGTAIKQRPRSKYCYRFMDVANVGHRCSQCIEERRRVLSCYARKLREKLRLSEKH